LSVWITHKVIGIEIELINTHPLAQAGWAVSNTLATGVTSEPAIHEVDSNGDDEDPTLNLS